MNCMWLDADLKQAARNHATKHQTKLILEATQMACSALHMNGLAEISPYQKTHTGHPMTRWAAESFDNWLLLREYASSLHEVRYGYSYADLAEMSLERRKELDDADVIHKSMRKFPRFLSVLWDSSFQISASRLVRSALVPLSRVARCCR